MSVQEMWERLLSGDTPQIRKAWQNLKDDEAAAVLAHLKRMAEEAGWAEAQRLAAQAALKTIRALND